MPTDNPPTPATTAATPTPTNAQPNAYLRTQVLTASPEQLRLMLLEGAIRFTRQGREALIAKDHEGIYNGFCKARDVVVELMTSIRPDTEPSLRSKVQGIYAFIFRQLMDASFEKDLAKADDAIKLLEYECETWKMALEKLKVERTGPVPTKAPSATENRPALSLQA